MAKKGGVLKVLGEQGNGTGLNRALIPYGKAFAYGASFPDGLGNLSRRIYSDVPELPPMSLNSGIPVVGQMPANLISYDVFLKKGGAANA